MQRSLESNVRTVKRLDEQMESILTVLRGLEESFSQLCTDVQDAHTRNEELIPYSCHSTRFYHKII